MLSAATALTGVALALTGLAAPPYRTLLTVSNGLLAKYGLWRARRDGTSARLHALAAQRPTD